MVTGKGKKLVYVSEDLIEKATRTSREEGVSLSKLIESALTEAVKVNELGYTSRQMAEFFTVLQTHRVLGGLFVPSGVLEFMIKKTSENGLQELQELWYESGKWNGKYLKEKFENPIEAFTTFLKLSRWDLNEVEVKEDSVQSTVKIRVVSTVMSMEGTKLLSKFMEGVMNGLNLKTGQLDTLKGMIILEFKK